MREINDWTPSGEPTKPEPIVISPGGEIYTN